MAIALNIAMVTVLTPNEYCEIFQKKQTSVKRVFLVQMCDGRDEKVCPYRKFVLMQDPNRKDIWLAFVVENLPTQNLMLDREKHVHQRPRMIMTNDHGLAFRATFDEVYLAMISYTYMDLNPVTYPL